MLGTKDQPIELYSIKDTAKVITSALLEKRAEKRRKKGKLDNQLLLDSDDEKDEDTYFR